MSRFNPREHAFILYLKLNDVRCHKLIEKFNIPKRGAQIGIQDLDLLVAETPGGKDVLLLQHPWLRTGYPILVNTQTDKKFFGFMDVEQELKLYHEHLDAYHAAILFKRTNTSQTLPGVSTGGWGQSQDTRPAPLIPTQQAPAPVAAPPLPAQTQIQLPPVKSEAKKMAAVPVALPPKQDPENPVLLKPEPWNFDNFVVNESPMQPSEPRLSDLARANGNAPAGLTVTAPPPPIANTEPSDPTQSESEFVDLEQGLEQPATQEQQPVEVITVPMPQSAPTIKKPHSKQPQSMPRPRTARNTGGGVPIT